MAEATLIGPGLSVRFTCPSCRASLALRAPRFKVRVHASGANVEPSWFCRCGLRGTVRRGRVVSQGRLGVPSAALLAYDDEERRPPATKEDARAEEEVRDAPDTTVGSTDCPEKTRHSVFSRRGEDCPVCGRSFAPSPPSGEEE
jgi:hypothetical protein